MDIGRVVMLISCVCLMGSQISANAVASQAESQGYTDTELMVLVDTSGSIKGKMSDIEIQWAQKICTFCFSTEIHSTYVYFDCPKIEYKTACSTSDGIKECLDTLADMPHDGLSTELAGPMEYAISFMEKKTASNKYIIMLSDGDEDLVSRNGRGIEEVPRSKEEEDNIEQFKNLVRKFDEKANQEVILVGLGTDVALFSELNNSDKVSYFPGNEGPEASIDYAFGKMGYPIDEALVNDETGRKTVDLRENLYRVIVNIQWDGYIENAEDMLNITHMSEKVENSLTIPIAGSSILVYIAQPDPGKYEIRMPVNNMTCTVFQQEKILLNSVELSIVSEDGKEDEDWTLESGEPQIKKYVIEEGGYKFFLKSQVESGDLGTWHPTVKYSIKPYNSEEKIEGYQVFRDEKWETAGFYREQNEISWKVPDQQVGSYVCMAKIMTNGQTYLSNIVLIQVKPAPYPDTCLEDPPTSIELKIGEKINLGAYISEEEAEQRYFSIQSKEGNISEKFDLKGTIKNEYFEVKEEQLIFLMEGTYRMSINEKNKERRIIEFKVTQKKSFWKKLIDRIPFLKSRE